ncbi:universal stress protein [Schlesneria paludicola]|uniref:universal stress protein n=1 Tax=Schlesneria paludicola TaxID=360056 RepID=UPI000299F34C|nr:universal stress protein [Schlesneria paludicola]
MKNLLVAVDFSDVTDRVVAQAEQLAHACGAKVWLLHCVHEDPVYATMGEVPVVLPSPDEDLSLRFAGEHQRLLKLATTLRSSGIDVATLFEWGVPTYEILSQAKEHSVDMIVMGSHGHGALYQLVFGSVAKSVMHETTIPILIVPSETHKATHAAAESKWEEPMATPY